MKLLLLLMLAAGANAFLSMNFQDSGVVETGRVLYKGVQLRSFKIDQNEVLEPYVALQATEKAQVLKTPVGKGFYFAVPVIVDSGVSAIIGGKKIEVMRLTSLSVSLRNSLIGQCEKDCSELSVTSQTQEDEQSVIFRCLTHSTCQRIFNDLHFNTIRSDFIRSALEFTFFGVSNGTSLRLTKSWVPVIKTSERPYSHSFWFEGDKLLLYTIKSGVGESAYDSFIGDNKFSIPHDGSLPDVYRSDLLDTLTEVLNTRSGDWELVAEMRVEDDLVAQIVFDVSSNREELDRTNWFNPKRVKSSYPFWIGRSNFNYFGVVGDGSNNRHFFVNRNYGGCPIDDGFWVVSDQRDPCPWANNGFKGRTPTLVYNKYPGKYQDRGVAYADRFFVYLRYTINIGISERLLPLSYEFEGNKIVLFTIKAGSGRDALTTYMSKQSFPIPKNASVLPEVYRSDLIDNLPDTVVSSGKKFIVAEMRVANKPVSQVFFDVSINRQTLTKENWFAQEKVVSSSPFFVGTSGFNYFSISGDNANRRNFFINYRYGGCDVDAGFMVVSNNRDPCTWANKYWTGKAPVLIYNTAPNSAAVSTAASAEQFLIYLV